MADSLPSGDPFHTRARPPSRAHIARIGRGGTASDADPATAHLATVCATVNAVLLGQYDSAGRLWYIGHAGTGRLTREEWRELTEVLRPLTVARTPFVNRPARIQGAFWVRPELTVKVQYSEWRWQEGRSLRHPSIQAIVNVPPEECRLP